MKYPILPIAITILVFNLLCTLSSANLFNANGLRGRQKQNEGAVRGRKKPAKKSSQERNNKPKKNDKSNRNNNGSKANKKNMDKDKKNKDKDDKLNKKNQDKDGSKPNKKNQDKDDKPNKKNQGKTKPNKNPGRDYDPRIIGGTVSQPNKYSFAVSLEERGSHFCGGSLIARNVILTAAHCNGGTYDITLGRPRHHTRLLAYGV